MTKLYKFVIGIKPAKRMFRVASLSGEVADALIESVGEKALPDDYFTVVKRSSDGASIQLHDNQEINSLQVDSENIVFTKDCYEESGYFDQISVFKEFNQLWDACHAVLKITNIRRIGIVGEYRIVPKSSHPSAELLKKMTRFEENGHFAKFHLQFEKRSLTTGESGLPDIKTSDFWNTIETYYDSELDVQHSEVGQITAMLDVQRYYSPLLNSNVPAEVEKLKRRFDEVAKQMQARLNKLGLANETSER